MYSSETRKRILKTTNQMTYELLYNRVPPLASAVPSLLLLLTPPLSLSHWPNLPQYKDGEAHAFFFISRHEATPHIQQCQRNVHRDTEFYHMS